MTKQSGQIHRRAMLWMLGMVTQVKAVALSQRVPELYLYVGDSEFVVIGSVERFVFRGASPKAAPQEFNQDFADQGGSPDRATDVVLRVEKVLYERPGLCAPSVARIHWAVRKEDQANVVGTQRIFLLGGRSTYPRPDGTVLEMRTAIIPPLPMEHEPRTLEAISKVTQRQ